MSHFICNHPLTSGAFKTEPPNVINVAPIWRRQASRAWARRRRQVEDSPLLGQRHRPALRADTLYTVDAEIAPAGADLRDIDGPLTHILGF